MKPVYENVIHGAPYVRVVDSLGKEHDYYGENIAFYHSYNTCRVYYSLKLIPKTAISYVYSNNAVINYAYITYGYKLGSRLDCLAIPSYAINA